ncbi:MAG: type II toxin-antitoxin system RelE/ParE family toxin [Chloroflexota bacterium]|nr:type II toxin-antitoxin system RelE/ParE family toxin [Anaerolineae bacterium]
MKVNFKRSFTKDLKGIQDKALLRRVKEVIELVERVQDLQEVKGAKKLRGGDRYYRIRIGEYRLGIVSEERSVTFVRFLHRRDIYRYFP